MLRKQDFGFVCKENRVSKEKKRSLKRKQLFSVFWTLWDEQSRILNAETEKKITANFKVHLERIHQFPSVFCSACLCPAQWWPQTERFQRPKTISFFKSLNTKHVFLTRRTLHFANARSKRVLLQHSWVADLTSLDSLQLSRVFS